MLNYLPSRLQKQLKTLNLNGLQELRLRQNKKILAILSGKLITINAIPLKEEIEEIVYNVCKKSIYSYEEQIKRGFITVNSGVRIGLCGEFVIKDDAVFTIKNFSSLCIRFPHEIKDFAKPFAINEYKGGSVLVISKSGVGKTTFIRDFSRCVSLKGTVNTIVIDERNEIVADNQFDVGEYVDVLTYSNKAYGFNQAIRTLNPSLIITDELMNESDINGVETAILSGVDVVATIHASSISDAFSKDFMKDKRSLFKYLILLEVEENKRVVTAFNNKAEILCRY